MKQTNPLSRLSTGIALVLAGILTAHSAEGSLAAPATGWPLSGHWQPKATPLTGDLGSVTQNQ